MMRRGGGFDTLLPVTITASREQIMRFRALASHLDEKLPPQSFAKAAWAGLQDSVPRGGVIALHARVSGTRPDSWEDPSVVQIWFRGGADYIVPRADAGIFTLGSFPRDPERGKRLERLADQIHRLTDGRTVPVREIQARLRDTGPFAVRNSALTGRVHIRWDASNIWIIPVERPDVDVEDARRELARRFLHWFGPATKAGFTRWAGVSPRDASETWKQIEDRLVPVEVEGEQRFMLAADADVLADAEPIRGVRLLPADDPFTKVDKKLLVPDAKRRTIVLPPAGESPGYIPGAVLVDGEIVGAWQRQQRKVTIHPFSRLSSQVREAIEQDALTFPIAGSTAPTVSWAENL
jgi:hypothetical protein